MFVNEPGHHTKSGNPTPNITMDGRLYIYHVPKVEGPFCKGTVPPLSCGKSPSL